MKTGKVILLGCGIAALCIVLFLVGGGFFIYHAAQPPKGMFVQIESPEEVKHGEQFELRIAVVNEHSSRTLKVSSVDIGESYLSGLTILRCEPAARSSERVPIVGDQSYTFEKSVPPMTTNVFVFQVRASKIGRYSGDVTVYEGMRSVIQLAQTRVIE